MLSCRLLAGALAFAASLACAAVPASAAAPDYRFEQVGAAQLANQKDHIEVRLVRVADHQTVADAVIFESTADMGPMGMATMTAPVTALPSHDGIYSFEIDPGMAGTWALHLAAKVQGETETVRGTLTAALVK